MGECNDCLEIKKLELQIKECSNHVATKDIEHDTMINSLSTRIVNMEEKYEELKQDVKKEVASINDKVEDIKATIPTMFKNAVNEMMARVVKYIALLIVGIMLIIALSVTRPILVQALQELTKKVEQAEINE